MISTGPSSSAAARAGNATIKYAFANIATNITDGAVVAAVASKRIVVTSMSVSCGATATNITFNSKPAGAGTAITGLYSNGALGGFVLSGNKDGYFRTAVGEGLSATTSAAGASHGITLTYFEE